MAKGKTGNTRFKKPIVMDLGDNPGEVEFADAQELFEWAEKQTDWSAYNIRKKSNIELFWPVLELQEAPSRNLSAIAQSILDGNASADAEVSKIKECLKAYCDHKAIHGQSEIGKLIGPLNNGWISSGALVAGVAYPLDEKFFRSIDHENLSFFLAGYTLAQSIFPRLKDAGAAAIRARFSRLLRTSQTEVENWQAKHDKLLHEASEKLEKTQKDASSQAAAMEATRKQYEDFMKLRSSASYWKEREEKSSKLAGCWGGAFGATVVLGLAVVYWGYPHLLSKFTSDDGSLGAGVIGLIMAPTAIVLMAMGLLFRSINSWLKDASMASERHTIIMTYLALAGDSKSLIDERHREHMLNQVLTLSSAEHTTPDQTGAHLGGVAARAFGDATRNDGG